ncbi:MAG: type VI secretion system lipoprotein TssJ [Deltaproteobacteria bacterium]|jgi:type VI secretion system VasD/TssJ family lipoprotein|nr:type VI secretion system lipoprotein TssJ [Deltaproteobacteria bacterium]
MSIRAPLRASVLLWPILLLCLLAAGCGASPPPKPALESEDPDSVIWAFGEKALRLRLSAAKDLNTFESRAHTLQLCVYQLDQRDAFDLRKSDQDGIDGMLQCAAFDKSVKSATRIFLQPGETALYILDRAEGARFAGVVCGYFEAEPERSAQLWQIPLSEERVGFIWKTTLYSAGDLVLWLHLSDHAMEEDKTQGKTQKQEKAQ